MLIRKHDAGTNEREWQEFVQSHDFGHLVAAGKNREIAVIVPTHFVFVAPRTVILHLAKDNPVWPALAENPIAIMSVAGAYAYIPTNVNASRSEPDSYGVPTSYYGAVQLIGACTTVEGAHLADLLNAQLDHFQPAGGHAEVEAGDNPYGRQLRGIRGLRMEVVEVRSKFKFGNNKTIEHRLRIADWLRRSDGENAAEAREHLIRRLEATERDGDLTAGRR